ncbi:SpoIIE family protein phosphatase [Pseudonocardia sp.]|uniref:SpoIIE family protein phosphatase n=1 Tax=Pseudonocardia sp. TaxID=60912 RepID=UPI003D10312A
MDHLPDAIFVHSGPEHHLTAVNRWGKFLAGPIDTLGSPARSVYPPDVADDLVGLLDDVYESGEPASGREWRFAVTRHDGRIEEHHVDLVATPTRDDQGEIAGVAVRLVDVTATVRDRRAKQPEATEQHQDRAAASQDVVLGLQQTLLARGLPVVPGVRTAARYVVTRSEMGAGGDWFDGIALDGSFAAVVGDVVGHGADAVAVMGQLRAVLGELLHDAGPAPDLAGVLARLDRAAARLPGARGATVCVAVLDPAEGRMRYACAGHPPPLVVSPDGSTRFLALPGGGPLGVPGPPTVVGHATLAPGELLVCFSDGLVERPGHDLALATAELASVASGVVRFAARESEELAEQVAQRIVEHMTRDGHDDDVTLLVVRRTGEFPPPLDIDVAAEAEQLATVRRSLQGWLRVLGAGRAQSTAVEIAVLEAVSNAIQHAYPGRAGGRVRVEGTLDGTGRLSLTVSDDGRWRVPGPDPRGRGRGLAMIRACVDEVEIERTREGTSVLLDHALRTAAVLDGAPSRPPARRSVRGEGRISVTHGTEPRIAVAGPIDIATAPALRRELREASRGGTLPLTVDLTGVSHLASAGVELLYTFVEEMQVDGRRVELVAPSGSPAGYALELTGLDRLVRT